MSHATSLTAVGAAAARLEAAGRNTRVLAVAFGSAVAIGPAAIPVTLAVAAVVADGPPVFAPFRARVTTAAQNAVTSLSRRERALWVGVSVVLVADVTTTSVASHAEANPVGVVLLATGGVPALVVAKIVLVGVVVGVRSWMPSHESAVPAVLVAVWGLASLNNVAVLLLSAF